MLWSFILNGMRVIWGDFGWIKAASENLKQERCRERDQ